MASSAVTPHLWKNSTSGYWYLVWQERGRKRRRSLKTKSRAVAQRALLEDQKRRLSGLADAPELSLAEAAEAWLADRSRPDRELRPSTLNDYRGFARALARCRYADALVAELGPPQIQEILDEIAPASAFSRKKKLGLFSMLYGWLQRMQYASWNPARNVEAPRVPPPSRQEITEEEHRALLEAADQWIEAAPRLKGRHSRQALRDLFVVLWHSGLRTIDAFRLTWEDVDLEQAVWTIRCPRNKGGVTDRPIHRELVPLLQRRKLLGSATVFPGEKACREAWRRFKAAHPELPSDLHGYRHAFETRYRRLIGPDQTAFLLGRRNSSSGDRYDHRKAVEFREQLDAQA